MNETEIENRLLQLERQSFPQPSRDPSKFRRERADEEGRRRAEADYLHTPQATEIRGLAARIQALETFVHALRGEDGIANDGPIFRLERRASASFSERHIEVELTFCDENDVQHTGIFWLKPGSIVPPL